MPHGGDATDREPGGGAHLIGRCLVHVVHLQHGGQRHGVDAMTPGGHDEDGLTVSHEDQGVRDLTHLDAQRGRGLLCRASAVVEGSHLALSAEACEGLAHPDDGLLFGDLTHAASVAGHNGGMSSPAGRRKAHVDSPPRFEGFPAEAFDFYAALEVNNTRPWWQEHKAQYEQSVRGPLVSLLSELEEEFGTPHVFRPYRDARFSKDKSPIKDHQGGVVNVEDAIAYYLQVSASGIMIAGGWYAPEGQQIARFRESVVGPAGAELERILAGMARTWRMDGNLLKTRPRGYDMDHPRIELLRHRRLTVARDYAVEPWLGTRKALTTVRTQWRAMRPLIEWLADYVGPAGDPSDDA